MKYFYIALFCSLASYGQTQIGADIDGEMAGDLSGRSVSLSSDGTIVAMGATGNDGNGSGSGHVRVYKNVSGTWIQIGSDINGEATGDQSGYSVSLSSDGSIVAIGAPKNDGIGVDSGHVRVYKNTSGTWTQVGGDINGEASGDNSGESLSLSSDGSILAIGANINSGNGIQSGHVRVYKNVSGIWTQVGADIDGEASGDLSGESLSLSSDGTVVAIGAIGNDGNASGSGFGHVRVYKNISGTWIQVGADIDGEATDDSSGERVSLSSDGSIVAIGAFQNDGNGPDSGHVRVYKNVSGTWTQIGADIDGEATGDQSVAVSLSSDGTVLVIGALRNDGNGIDSGHVRVYKNISGSWVQTVADINGKASGDLSGLVSLSSDGNVLVVGAPLNDGNGTDSGHVRVYNLSTVLSNDSFVFKNFRFYPNPVSDVLMIELANNLVLQKVNFYNTLGQLIKTTNSNQINILDLAKGNYFVEVITNKGKATKTFVVK
jgi:Flp pilus assembly pilin Flp